MTLPSAVTSEPELDWSWQAPGDVEDAVAEGESTYVLTSGSLFALDDSGDELWDVEVEGAEYLSVAELRTDLLWLSGSDGGGSLRSTEDGEEVLAIDGELETVLEGQAIVSDDDELSSINLDSGDVEWTTEGGESIAVDGGSVFILADDQLRRLALDGEEQWTADAELALGDYPYMTTADGFVVVNGEDTAIAFDGQDGEELWSVDTGDDGGSAGLMFPDQVYIQKNDFSFEDDTEDTKVVIYDRDGRVASFDPGTSFFYAFPVRSEGDVYAFDFGEGILYDEEFEALGRSHDGSVQPVDGGLYELSEGEVSFFRNDESSAAWTLDDEFGDDAQLGAAEDRLLIADGSDLLSYR
ncbi:hypothetical protein GCM10009843_03580 [Nocardioides bigeumensis]|uniref:Pyrrolo-quinoline quinone repeat domain-containing protein n=2 Tax=Nocardioides bigeumensis TaxID=433657 RepID=A0ABN2XQ28_9ACTN